MTKPTVGPAGPRSQIEGIADKFQRCGWRFVPLIDVEGVIGGDAGSACALDILFLRRDSPGGLVAHGGDIDNRIKVLFDALRMPESCDELPKGQTPTHEEDPFYCLLKDDRIIANVAVTTDRLLTPVNTGHIHDVKLIIHVKTLALGGDF